MSLGLISDDCKTYSKLTINQIMSASYLTDAEFVRLRNKS